MAQIILNDEQQKVVSYSPVKALFVRGAPGSGKTTTMLARANCLFNLYQESSKLFWNLNDDSTKFIILIFTYNKLLKEHLAKQKNLTTFDSKEFFSKCIVFDYETKKLRINKNLLHKGNNIIVTNFHQFSYQIIINYYENMLKLKRDFDNISLKYNNMKILNTVYGSKLENLIKDIVKYELINESSILASSDALSIIDKCDYKYFAEEFEWICGNEINNLEDYLKLRSFKRKDHLNKYTHNIVWALYELMRSYLYKNGLLTFADFALEAKKVGISKICDHVLIDEAQDMNKSELDVMTSLPQTNGAYTIFYDIGQRIYNKSKSKKYLSIDMQGKRSVLKKSYRCSIEIAALAEDFAIKHNVPLEKGDRFEFHSDKPKLYCCYDDIEQYKQIEVIIENILKNNDGNIAVLAKTKKIANSIYMALRVKFTNLVSYFEDCKSLNKTVGPILVSTMASAKGLEFDHVILCSLNHGVIPYIPEIENDEENDENLYSDACLFYMAISRAKHSLHLISSNLPSSFLEGINPNLITNAGIDLNTIDKEHIVLEKADFKGIKTVKDALSYIASQFT